MANWTTNAAIALAASTMAASAPASATIFEYTMTNGDVLAINTANGTGSWTGEAIKTSFTGDFSSFTGGANPSFKFTLGSLTGTRKINGKTFTPTNVNGSKSHPYMLKTQGQNKVNLWAWWTNPHSSKIFGDYVKTIGEYKVYPPVDVPAPGALGLFGLALIALGFGRRRRSRLAAA